MVKKYLTTRYNCGERERESLFNERRKLFSFFLPKSSRGGFKYLVASVGGVL